MTTTLVATAFGPTASLYDALLCDKRSDSSELKRAYRRQALRYHPDKAAKSDKAATNQTGNTSSTIQNDDTLKFQAVSAAYSVLRDCNGRKLYDSTGQVRDDDDDDDDDDETSTTTTKHQHNNFRGRGRNSKASNRSNNNNDHDHQQHWDDFFHSVFQEIVTVEQKHDRAANTYRGSDQEIHDVIHYYTICKGNFSKMVDCIVHGEIQDTKRWKNNIVNPAIVKGEIVRYVYTSDYDDGRKTKAVKRGKKKRLRKVSNLLDRTKKVSIKKTLLTSSRKVPLGTSNNSCIVDNNTLVDTDDEEEMVVSKETTNTAPNDAHSFSSHDDEMSRKDKLEYHAATKRKQKAKKEIEFANLLNSKTWSGDVDATKYTTQQERRERKTGPFTEALLSSMEKKYSAARKRKYQKV